AALSAREHPITLSGSLRSEDTEVMIDCLRRLGFDIEADWRKQSIVAHPVRSERVIPNAKADLFVGNSGTTMRVLTAMGSLGEGACRLDGVPRMRERPIQDLLDALQELGVNAVSENGNGCPPVRIETTGWKASGVEVRGAVSSQFLSGLMLAAPFAPREKCVIFDENL